MPSREIERVFAEVEGVSHIKSQLSKARRALKGDAPDRVESMERYLAATTLYQEELVWRRQASESLLSQLNTYNTAIYDSIGLRLQQRLPIDRANSIAACLSEHKDISLRF